MDKNRCYAILAVIIMIFGIMGDLGCFGHDMFTVSAAAEAVNGMVYNMNEADNSKWRDNREVPYDRSDWIQPKEWNCPKIDPRDYEGGIMIYFDKIGLYSEYAKGKVQRVYVSIVGATEPVNMMKFHIFYDPRLKVSKNSKDEVMTAGKAINGFKTGSAMVEEGELVFYAYSQNDVMLSNGSLFTIDFTVPEDAKLGDVYPIGMAYVDDGIAYDTFLDSAQTDAGKLQMTYVFTKGIYNGYIKILDEESHYVPDNSSEPDSSSKVRDSSSKAAESSSGKNTSSKTEDRRTFMRGDANLDGKINVTDIAVVASHIKGIKALTGDGLKAADVNADKEINVTDIAMIASHIKGIKAL